MSKINNYSPPHDVDGENATLMSCEQIIDEVADDGIRFVAESCDHAADEHSGASMPFQIDRAVRIPSAVDLGPAVRPARPLVLRRDQIEFFLELRIGHDLVPQRSASAGDHLDDCLHR
jgi:hypothetical protein